MGMELFAEVAALPFADRHVVAVEDVDFLAPVKFYRDEPRTLRVSAQYRSDGDDVVAECRWSASDCSPTRTSRSAPSTSPAASDCRANRSRRRRSTSRAADHRRSADDDLRDLLPRPAYQVLDEAWRADGDVVGRMVDDLPAEPGPADAPLATAPALTELCFQTAGVWEIGTTGSMALPMRVGRVVPTVGAEPAGDRARRRHPPTTEASRHTWSTATGESCSGSRAIGRSSCPAPSTTTGRPAAHGDDGEG